MTTAALPLRERRTSGYAPRNALNADELKRTIAARSTARDDTPEVRAWLLNHFLRHVVANFSPARPIASLDDARDALGSRTLPAWLANRFDRASGFHAPAAQSADVSASTGPNDVPLVWVDPAAPSLIELEGKLLEFLHSRVGTPLEGKLARVNCLQALAIWDAEHAKLAERIERGWRHSCPEALRIVTRVPTGTLVELLPHSPMLREEMAYESYIMRHCLGQFANRRQLTGGYGERYATSVSSEKMRVFSLRDSKGEPRITISAHVGQSGSLTLEQVKGKQNRPPIERYIDDLLVCLDALHTDAETPADCVRIGILRTPDGWRRMQDVTDPWTQVRLVSRYPQLYAQLPTPTPLVDWLVAGRQRNLLDPSSLRSAALRYALGQSWEKSAAPGNMKTGWRFVTGDVGWPNLSEQDARPSIAAANRMRRLGARLAQWWIRRNTRIA